MQEMPELQKQEFNIYCDESCHLEHDEQSVMLIGGIWCPKDEVNNISKNVRELKERFKARGEIKWTKVSDSRLDFFKELVIYFFKNNYLHFRCLVVNDKSKLNHSYFNQGSHDTFYYKMYFGMLEKILKKENKYFLFFGANDIQNDKEYGGIGVAVAGKPEGPFKDYLGKPLIDKFHNGAQQIDQFVFHDKDGKYYIIYGGWRHCNIARLNNDFTGFIPFDDGKIFKEITPENYVEGPIMFIRKNKYYFMWSEGGWGGPNYSVAYAMADSPFGPFTRVGKILQQDPAVATGAGHHSVIHNAKEDSWYIVYHRRPLGETDANHRVTCIDKMYFDESGKILPVKITFEGVKTQALK
jgi:hypothetical protein